MLDLGKRLKNMSRSDDTEDLFSSGSGVVDVENTVADDADSELDNSVSNAAETVVPETESIQQKKSERSSIFGDRLIRSDAGELDKMAAAGLLEEARCRMGLSPADVEEITKIRAVYIQALEKGDFEELPQAVYTLAYLRRLCELYGLSKEEEEKIIAPWSELQFETPDNYSTTVYSDESGDNRMVIRKLEIAIFSFIALAVIALIVFGVIMLIPFLRGSGNDSSVSFDEAEIVKIQPVPVLQVNEPMPQGRR